MATCFDSEEICRPFRVIVYMHRARGCLLRHLLYMYVCIYVYVYIYIHAYTHLLDTQGWWFLCDAQNKEPLRMI
jgi:hypothetical protein